MTEFCANTHAISMHDEQTIDANRFTYEQERDEASLILSMNLRKDLIEELDMLTNSSSELDELCKLIANRILKDPFLTEWLTSKTMQVRSDEILDNLMAGE